MPIVLESMRFKSFVVVALAAAGLTSIVGAQNATPSDQDATFRPNASTAAASSSALPGGVVTLHIPGNGGNLGGADTRTPIKHVILLIGENRTFDHVFATYTPPAGQTVHNLLSEGIVNADGTPGPNVAAAQQWQASNTGAYSNAPTHTSPYALLPADEHRRRADPAVSRFSGAGTSHRTSSAGRGLRRTRRGRHGPAERCRRYAFPRTAAECAGRYARLDQLRRLRQQPGASLLPDVAAARLQYPGRHAEQPQRLPQ